MSKGCTCQELVETVEEFIPTLLLFLSIFIFISLVYRCLGKSRSLYWFILIVLFIFDVVGLGFSVEYISAIDHACSCSCDDEL